MNKFKAALYILSWVPLYLLLTFPLLMVWPFIGLTWWQAFLPVGLIFLGIPIVGYLARKPMSKWPRWTWLWQNDGDAVVWELGAMRPPHDVPRWYYKKHGPDGDGWSAYKMRFSYMALRNPVNNHRFLFTDVKAWRTSGDPEAFDTEGSDLIRKGLAHASGWRYAGAFAGWRRIWLNGTDRYSEVYFGWKVGSAVPGLGFTFQLRLKRDFIHEV